MKETLDGACLQEAVLCEALGDLGGALSLHVCEELDSTSSEAKRLAVSGARTPLLIVAARQTAGRGRMGRSFYSPAATGVYFSLLFEANAPLERALSVTSAASVAVMRAVRRLLGIQVAIKWVNDLYFNGKKVCGILTEAISGAGETPKIIVGIGINLCTDEFPPELREKAGSLGARELSREATVAAVVRELWPYLCDPTDHSWLADYRAHSCVIGRPITWREANVTRSGVACGIDETGALEVRSSDGRTERLRTGEISLYSTDRWE